MTWYQVLTSSLGAGLVIWFLSSVQDWVKRRLESRKLIRQLRLEINNNLNILKTLVGPRNEPFPLSSFVLVEYLSKGMFDIKSSEYLTTAMVAMHSLYNQLYTYWNTNGSLVQNLGVNNPEVLNIERAFSFLVSDLYIPLLGCALELFDIELSLFKNKKEKFKAIEVKSAQLAKDFVFKITAKIASEDPDSLSQIDFRRIQAALKFQPITTSSPATPPPALS